MGCFQLGAVTPNAVVSVLVGSPGAPLQGLPQEYSWGEVVRSEDMCTFNFTKEFPSASQSSHAGHTFCSSAQEPLWLRTPLLSIAWPVCWQSDARLMASHCEFSYVSLITDEGAHFVIYRSFSFSKLL